MRSVRRQIMTDNNRSKSRNGRSELLTDTDRALAARATCGDEQALTVLLARTRNMLRARVEQRIPARLRGRLDGEDIVQETHREVFLHMNSFVDQGQNAFLRWIVTIALNILRNEIAALYAAKRGADQRVQGVSKSPNGTTINPLDVIERGMSTPSRIIARGEGVGALHKAIESLPPDYRDAVNLVYLHQIPIAAVAVRMGRSQRAIHNLCYKAKRQLRETLGSRSLFLTRS